MTLSEKVAYIKGLTAGLKLDDNKAEVKVINEILSLLEDITVSVNNIEEHYDELTLQVDEIDEDLSTVEEDLYSDDEDEELFDDEENPLYEVTCPECGAVTVVDEDMLLEGEIPCPECDNTLEFDFSGLFDEDGCICGNPECEGCQDN